MPKLLLPLTLVALLILAACGGAPAALPPLPEMTSSESAAGAPVVAPGAPAAVEGRGAGDQPAEAQPSGQRLVIKNAYLSVEVESVDAAESSLRARAEQLGGYVVSVQTSGSDASKSSTITFRVPAASFDAALADIEGLARRVFSRTVSGEDVTEEFVDLESQLRNLEATRERLIDLLARATRVEDALQVNQALTDVQGQIEQIQGRMKYLQQSAAMSTITVELQPVAPPPTIVEPDSWQPLRVAGEALGDLVGFGQDLASALIVLLVWTPIWLPLILGGRWLVRRATRRAPPKA